MNPAERDATIILDNLARKDRAVGKALKVHSFEAGETVCSAGEMANSLCLVVSGRVQLFRTSNGSRHFALAALGPGSMFGEEALLGGTLGDSCALALERCTVWTLPGSSAQAISATNPMFGFGLMQAMGQRLAETEDLLEQMAYGTISSRLAALLLELGGGEQESAVITTHQQLADMLNTWRETISKIVQDFRRRGLVASGRRRLTLLDIRGLQLEAGGTR